MTKPAKATSARKKVVARRRPTAPPPPPKPKERAPAAPAGTKLARLEAALRAKGGATIPELMEVSGWQAHSVRGALAGALKQRGLTIESERVDGERRYRVRARA